jgi:hypothetical protein
MIFKIILNLAAGFFVAQTMSACSNVEQTAVPMSQEGQKRIRAQQEAKIKQERNNQIRAANYQIQEQNRLEQRELERLRAERAAQRNAKRAMPQSEEKQNK